MKIVTSGSCKCDRECQCLDGCIDLGLRGAWAVPFHPDFVPPASPSCLNARVCCPCTISADSRTTAASRENFSAPLPPPEFVRRSQFGPSDCESDGISDLESESDDDTVHNSVIAEVDQPPDSLAAGWGYSQTHGGAWTASPRDFVSSNVPVTVGPACPESRDPLLSRGLTVSSVRNDYFTTRFPRHRESSEGSSAAARLIARKNRFRMTAKYVYARDRAVLHPSVREDILSWAGLFDDRKSICELFPRAGGTSFPPLSKSSQGDVWNQCWSDSLLWVQAPRAQWGPVIQKILVDQAKRVALIPVDKSKSWFWSLGEVAVDWWDLPHQVLIFGDCEGWQYPQQKGVTTRVVLFDAFGCDRGPDRPDMAWDDVQPGECPEGTDGSAQVKAKRLRTLHPDCPRYHAVDTRSVRGAVEADKLDSRCQQYREQLEKEFADVFSFPNVQEVPDDLRGPHSMHRIKLKDGSGPQKCSPIRLAGLREAAFRSLIQIFEGRGMLTTSESEWRARAFIVPKPGVNKWRLVIDYRYLNTCISDDADPLPVIEDMVARQSGNALWSVFDLEDGFHQMHLHPDSQPLTAFVTPWGLYELRVLPMGLKTEPSAYQRLVSWCLRDFTRKYGTGPYIDDVCHGTADKDNPDPVSLDDPLSDRCLLDHYAQLREFFSIMRRCRLTIRPGNYVLFATRVKFCGHVLMR